MVNREVREEMIVKKICPKCKILKQETDFYKRSGKNSHLLRSYCKSCEVSYRNLPYVKNKVREKERQNYRTRLSQWLFWFKEIYGETPKCQVCDVVLHWNGGNDLTAVVFDHRHGGSEVIKMPYNWCSDRKLNSINKELFLRCDFGVLCKKCNTTIPTRERIDWLQKVTKYVYTESNTERNCSY